MLTTPNSAARDEDEPMEADHVEARLRSRGGTAGCFYSTTIRGTTACGVSNAGPCANLQARDTETPCPVGHVCAICDCLTMPPIFRCKRLCPAA